MAQGLQEAGIKAVPYHADMSVVERERYHTQWSFNHVQVIVATVCFSFSIKSTHLV